MSEEVLRALAGAAAHLRHKRTGPIRECRTVPQADPVWERSARVQLFML